MSAWAALASKSAPPRTSRVRHSRPFFAPARVAALLGRGRQMRRKIVAIAALALGAAALSFGAFATPRIFADKRPNAIPVDVELVLAVDVSYSMDPEEQALQRDGYVQALTSREFMRALREGPNGKIAVTYVEWAGQFDQKIVM